MSENFVTREKIIEYMDMLFWSDKIEFRKKYFRHQDDHDGKWDSGIQVYFTSMNRSYVRAFNPSTMSGLRFRCSVFGGGKSVTVHALINSLLYKNLP